MGWSSGRYFAQSHLGEKNDKTWFKPSLMHNYPLQSQFSGAVQESKRKVAGLAFLQAWSWTINSCLSFKSLDTNHGSILPAPAQAVANTSMSFLPIEEPTPYFPFVCFLNLLGPAWLSTCLLDMSLWPCLHHGLASSPPSTSMPGGPLLQVS